MLKDECTILYGDCFIAPTTGFHVESMSFWLTRNIDRSSAVDGAGQESPTRCAQEGLLANPIKIWEPNKAATHKQSLKD